MIKRTMQEIADFFGVGVMFDGYRTTLLDENGAMGTIANRLVYLDGVAPHTVVLPVTDTCTWTEDENGAWHTTCGNCHELFDGTPVENGFKYCPYCGKELVEKMFEYEGEEEAELIPTCENCLHYDGCFVDSDEPGLPQDEVSVYERCCLGCACNEGPGECAKGNMLCDSWEEKEDV